MATILSKTVAYGKINEQERVLHITWIHVRQCLNQSSWDFIITCFMLPSRATRLSLKPNCNRKIIWGAWRNSSLAIKRVDLIQTSHRWFPEYYSQSVCTCLKVSSPFNTLSSRELHRVRFLTNPSESWKINVGIM